MLWIPGCLLWFHWAKLQKALKISESKFRVIWERKRVLNDGQNYTVWIVPAAGSHFADFGSFIRKHVVLTSLAGHIRGKTGRKERTLEQRSFYIIWSKVYCQLCWEIHSHWIYYLSVKCLSLQWLFSRLILNCRLRNPPIGVLALCSKVASAHGSRNMG